MNFIEYMENKEIAAEFWDRVLEEHYIRWRHETKFISSMSVIVSHRDCRSMVNVGNVAIPFLLKKLKEEDAMVFAALMEITQHQPFECNNFGDFEAMKKSWLEWGRLHGYID